MVFGIRIYSRTCCSFVFRTFSFFSHFITSNPTLFHAVGLFPSKLLSNKEECSTIFYILWHILSRTRESRHSFYHVFLTSCRIHLTAWSFFVLLGFFSCDIFNDYITKKILLEHFHVVLRHFKKNFIVISILFFWQRIRIDFHIQLCQVDLF